MSPRPSPMAPATLLYRDTCPRCRVLSRVAVALSLGTVRRVPLASVEAAEVVGDRPALRGKLLLSDGTETATGWGVVGLATRLVVRLVVRRWLVPPAQRSWTSYGG